jgi:hypothetical protein
MFALLRMRFGSAVRTKAGIALIGALLVGGAGTAMAMATAHSQLPSTAGLSGATASSTAHSDDRSGASKTPGATKTDDQDDQDDKQCTGSTSATPAAHSDDGSEHESSTPSATRAAGQSDDEANEHESTQDDQDECGRSTASHTPEPTERPEGTHTAGATPTKGPGDD